MSRTHSTPMCAAPFAAGCGNRVSTVLTPPGRHKWRQQASKRRGAQQSWKAEECCRAKLPSAGGRLSRDRRHEPGRARVSRNSTRARAMQKPEALKVADAAILSLIWKRGCGGGVCSNASLTLSLTLKGDTSRPAFSHETHSQNRGRVPHRAEVLEECSERGTRPTPRDKLFAMGDTSRPAFLMTHGSVQNGGRVPPSATNSLPRGKRPAPRCPQ